MDVPSWFQAWLDAAWYEKIFWLFMIGGPIYMAFLFLSFLFEGWRDDRRKAQYGRRMTRSSGGIGFTDSYSPTLNVVHHSSDSTVEMADAGSESGGSDSGGGDFSGGGGDYGGGGSGGSWS